MRQNRLSTQDVVVMYVDQHLTLRQIGSLVGMSATAVSKRLRSAGITADQGEWLDRQCGFCNAPLRVTRAKARRSIRSYCNPRCAGASHGVPTAYAWRNGSRLARLVVAQHFPLQPEHIVHHVDGDQRNNDRSNLLVFANQSDHVRYHHHGSTVVPLWTGQG